MNFSERIISRECSADSKERGPEYDPVINRIQNQLVQHHTGNIMEHMLVLEVPGGILINKSYGPGVLLATIRATLDNSSQRNGMCQLSWRRSFDTSDQNSFVNSYRERRHISARTADGFRTAFFSSCFLEYDIGSFEYINPIYPVLKKVGMHSAWLGNAEMGK